MGCHMSALLRRTDDNVVRFYGKLLVGNGKGSNQVAQKDRRGKANVKGKRIVQYG